MRSKSLRLTQATTRSLLISAQYCPEFLVCQEERARTSRFRTPTRHMYVCISIRPAEKTKGISWTATRVLILSQRYSMPGHQRLSQTSESSQYRIHQASPTRQSPDLFNSAVLLIHPTPNGEEKFAVHETHRLVDATWRCKCAARADQLWCREGEFLEPDLQPVDSMVNR